MRLERLAQQNQLLIGISDAFSSLTRARTAYGEALNALALQEKGSPGRIVLYDACKETLLTHALRNTARRHNVVPNNLAQAARFDAEHGTCYVETARALLECGRSKTRACERLCIHRNTLDYRLARMRDQFGIDLENEETSHLFLLVFSSGALDATTRCGA